MERESGESLIMCDVCILSGVLGRVSEGGISILAGRSIHGIGVGREE